MKIIAEVLGSVAQAIEEAEGEIGARVRLATARHTERLKQRLRQDVLAAGMGRRMANTWQSQVYPAGGRRTLSPAGYVYSRAPMIISGFSEGATIRGKDGQWLAIPTGAVPYGGNGLASVRSSRQKKQTPQEVEATYNRELRIVRPRGGEGRFAFLVMDGLTRAKGRAGGRGRFRLRTSGRARQGRTEESVIMFVLVPQVRLKKLFDLAASADRAASDLQAELASAL
ncbi:MAG: DUF6441 family protein [Reyranellaceae bacterium]